MTKMLASKLKTSKRIALCTIRKRQGIICVVLTIAFVFHVCINRLINYPLASSVSHNFNNNTIETISLPLPSDCTTFDHGDPSPLFLNLTSIFNCNAPSGKCKYFFPARFFDPSCGIGRKYNSGLLYLEKLREQSNLWKGGPPIVLPWASMNPDMKPNDSRNKDGIIDLLPRHNLSMVHVHKTGGTSLVNAFASLARTKPGRGARMTSYSPMFAFRRSSTNATTASRLGERGRERFKTHQHLKQHRQGRVLQNRLLRKRINGTAPPLKRGRLKPKQERPKEGSFNRSQVGKFISGAVKYRKKWGPTDHTLFAVIRDPAERFISSIGQALGGIGTSSKSEVAKKLNNECLTSNFTPTEILRCFVNLIERDGTAIEVHFTPMAYEISFATMYMDIPTAIFQFEAIPSLMYELNASPKSKRKSRQSKGYVLGNITVDDYEEETLKALCRIYGVDVLLFNLLDYPTLCSKYDIGDD